ncbi:MAG: UvrD-helicase domain-containing protein [Candidatus Omnitrophota bacterium]
MTKMGMRFPEIRTVVASAGSGKTYALATRYVQLLLGSGADQVVRPRRTLRADLSVVALARADIPLRNILAITFTNKAAIEMKERIIRFLKMVSLDSYSTPEEKNNILAALKGAGVSAAESLPKAGAALDYLIRNYNFFQVQTIDSFINAILSACAFKLNLSANFQVREDLRDYLSYSLDEVLQKASEGNKRARNLLEEFLRQYIRLEENPSWLPRRDIFSIISSLFHQYNIYAGVFRKYPKEITDVFPLQEKITENIKKLYRNLPEGTNGTFKKSLERFCESGGSFFSVKEVPVRFSRDDFPVNKGFSAPLEIVGLWQEIKADLDQLCRLQSSAVFNRYIDIYYLVEKEFRKLSGKDDVIFLEELNSCVQGLIGRKAVSVPEIYYRLATRFNHYLIDEFQDTSQLQWQNLYLLLEEALSRAGSLFCVGDRKQAVYRFRGGDDFLLASLEKGKEFPASPVFSERLNKNYRSHKEIVEFNNGIFAPENVRRFLAESKEAEEVDSPEAVVSVFADSRQEHLPDKDKGYVRVEKVGSSSAMRAPDKQAASLPSGVPAMAGDASETQESEETIKTRVKELAAGLLERFAPGDIAILSRDNARVELITGWLLEAGFPVESEKTLNVRENPLVKELFSFLKFLNSPVDNLSCASFLTGNIFLNASGLGREQMHDFIFSAGGGHASGVKCRRGGYLYTEFRSLFRAVWDDLIEEFFNSVGFYPPYELTVSIIRKFDILRNFPGCQGFFMRFLEIIREQEEEQSSLAEFLEYFQAAPTEKMYVAATPGNAVRVMTIHKAKGLEFPVVVVPFLGIDINVNRRGGWGAGRVRSSSFSVYQARDNKLDLMQLNKDYARFSPEIRERYRQEYSRSLIDELDSVYVALTRAAEELYVFIPDRVGNRKNPAWHFISGTEIMERGEKRLIAKPGKADFETFSPEASKPLAYPAIAPAEYPDWINLLKDEFVDEHQLRNRVEIERGEVLHRVLSGIGNLTGADVDSVIRTAIEDVQSEYLLETKELTELEKKVRRLLDDPRFKPLFFLLEGESVFAEKDVVDSRGNVRRIDRLIVKPNRIDVFDYKSSGEGMPEHRKQLAEYIDIVKEIYPDKEVAGILIYLDGLKMVEV